MQSNRNTEFDHLFGKGRWSYANVLALFRGSVPYSWNVFTDKKPRDIAMVKGILEHIQNGYPHEGRKLRFEDNPENVYAYLLMIKAEYQFEDPKGEIARKLDYALERMTQHGIFKGITSERFHFVLAELKTQADDRQQYLNEFDELHRSSPTC